MVKVSIIIPCYNAEKYISETLKSVFSQTFGDYEVLLIDDGSTDDSLQLVREQYGEKVRIFTQKNKRVAAARNVGLAQSAGEYLSFLDADDIWLPEKLELQTEFLDANKGVDLVYSDTYEFNDLKGIFPKTWLQKRKHFTGSVFKEIFIANFIPTSTVMLRKSCLEDSGYFDEDLLGCEDGNLWMRIALNHEIGCLEKPLAKYRINPVGISHRHVEINKSRIKSHERILKTFPDRVALFHKEAKNKMAYLNFEVAKYAIIERRTDISTIFYHIFKSLRWNPFYWKSYALFLCWPCPSLFIKKSREYRLLWAIPVLASPTTGGEYYFSRIYHALGLKWSLMHTLKIPGGKVTNRLRNFAGKIIVRLKCVFALNPSVVIKNIENSYSSLFADYFANLFAVRLKCKTVLNVREQFLKTIPAYRSPIRQALIKNIINKADIIVANSRSTKKWVEEYLVENVPIYISSPTLRDDLKFGAERPDRKGGNFIILCVANIRRDKGQEYLIKAVAEMNNENILVNLVGEIKEEKYFQYLKELLKIKGLMGKVCFTGFMESCCLAKYYSNADIFVLPTLREGYGQVLLEAMYFGLPVVASRVGGIPEVVTDRKDGILVNPGDETALRKVLQELSDNVDLRRKLSEAAREKAGKLFSWESVEENYIEIVQSVLKTI